MMLDKIPNPKNMIYPTIRPNSIYTRQNKILRNEQKKYPNSRRIRFLVWELHLSTSILRFKAQQTLRAFGKAPTLSEVEMIGNMQLMIHVFPSNHLDPKHQNFSSQTKKWCLKREQLMDAKPYQRRIHPSIYLPTYRQKQWNFARNMHIHKKLSIIWFQHRNNLAGTLIFPSQWLPKTGENVQTLTATVHNRLRSVGHCR